MNKFHLEILEEIKKKSGKGSKHSGSDSYLSSGHFYYSVSNPIKRDWPFKKVAYPGRE